MSSALNKQTSIKSSKMRGTASLRRSRTYALWSMAILVFCLFFLSLIPMPVPSVRAEISPLVLEMRQFSPMVLPEPVPQIVQQVKTEKILLLAEDSPEVVALSETKPQPKSTPKPEKKKNPTEPIPKKKQEKREPKAESIKKKASSTIVAQAKLLEPSPHGFAAVTPVNSAENAAKEKQALALLMQAIERNKEYPKQARRANTQGTITLLVEVGPDGKVKMCSVQGGGPSVLEKATRQLGEKLMGLNLASSGQPFSVRVPVNYSLH